MGDILIRGLPRHTIERLKARAKRNGRSLQAEARLLLEQSAGARDVAEILDRWDEQFAGRSLCPTADMLREDRDR
jgi:hypothetical protein